MKNTAAAFLALCLVPSASTCLAQTAETVAFRAVMSSANEPSPPSVSATGMATILAHVVRDTTGVITSATVDFTIDYGFPDKIDIVGLHIHPGAPGTNGPAEIRTAFAPITGAAAKGTIVEQAQIASTDTSALTTLIGMLQNPGQYYVNLHTSADPAGALRGQLQRADIVVRMGVLASENEPKIPSQVGSGVASVIALVTRDAGGALTSGRLIYDVNYKFPAQVTIAGLHIHPGIADESGPAVLRAPLAPGITSDANGAGNLHSEFEVNVADAVAADTFNRLLDAPATVYLNVHTTADPAGAIRAQLRPVDRMKFQVNMLPANETPPITNLNGSAPSAVTLYTLRAPDGKIIAGIVNFDVNYRFPGAVQFVAMHIHKAPAGTAGGVEISAQLAPVKSDTGFGNIYRTVTVSDPDEIAVLNDITVSPETYYLNIHSTDHPGGVARAQLTAANASTATVTTVSSVAIGVSGGPFAPGELISIYGKNQVKVATDLSGWSGAILPTTLNGTTVTIGGVKAPMLFVSSGQIRAQVPFELAPGEQKVIVNNGNGASASIPIMVAAVAPKLLSQFFGTGVVAKNSDFSLVDFSNPATAGDVLLIYSTGLGQTNPPLKTADIVPDSPLSATATTTVTIGGQDAEVVYSIASPGFPGAYQTAVRMPAGIAPGVARVLLTIGGVTSNPVTIAVQ